MTYVSLRAENTFQVSTRSNRMAESTLSQLSSQVRRLSSFAERIPFHPV